MLHTLIKKKKKTYLSSNLIFSHKSIFIFKVRYLVPRAFFFKALPCFWDNSVHHRRKRNLKSLCRHFLDSNPLDLCVDIQYTIHWRNPIPNPQSILYTALLKPSRTTPNFYPTGKLQIFKDNHSNLRSPPHQKISSSLTCKQKTKIQS